ncbi:MAG: MBL fold metallo-hydrolase [Candidatus Micrarchaeota archaeon]
MIQYLGHSSFRIALGDTVCIINPVISDRIGGERRIVPSALNLREIKKCDLILLTSEAQDHCEPATVEEIVEKTYASVIAPKPALAKINISEKFKVDVRVGDRFSIKGVDVSINKAVHPQAEYPVGYGIKGGKWRVYHAGGTYSFTNMASIKCDVALLPIGGTYTMDPFAAANACKEIRPKYVVPMNYDTVPKIRQDVSEFTKDLPSCTKPLILKPGASARLPD